MDYNINSSRRRFLQQLSCTTAALALPSLATAAVEKPRQVRRLAFDNLHTGEKLTLTYFEQGHYIDEALQEINHLLRDHRSGEMFAMDPALFDLLFDMQTRLGSHRPFQVISGYRSPTTNAKLQKATSGVATKSLHMRGKAIDIRMEGVDSATIRRVAMTMRRGGVGYYPTSNFVHIDTGRVRSW
ncbi:DUF882 domain-containing protein [Methylomarinum sp. Ch1-1]|uniref:Murein endopeptidase K n=1 Tax=Methylomarinum roseum TaxID=3067653 RepID=A0AAU7NVF4_9GAMM|nr:DUF882 domain-containing protein [Methylomarinum sp. Ch1-1]MDP4523039.1 DUF882 domain-containing protein [Methylomarinum sp. Ch1-1]